jgi:DNA-binding MarR family transcriptional regulator
MLADMTATHAPCALSDEIGEAFATLMRASRAPRAFERVREQAGVEFDRTGSVALDILLTNGPQRVSELAEASGVDVSTMSRLIGRLSRDGLVGVGQLPSDRRVVLVHITERGEAELEALRQARREMLSEFLATWSDADRASFARLLWQFVHGVEQAAKRDAAGARATGAKE